MNPLINNYLIVDLIQQRSQDQPERLALCYLADGETETERLTYQALNSAAKKIAAHLQALNLKNKYAIMLYSSGTEFVKAFFGCLYAGVIAVPTYVPKSKQLFYKIEVIAEDCNASAILTTQDFLEENYISTSKLAHVLSLATDQLSHDAAEYHSYDILPEATAFVQYTSGSTSQPKGVVVSHKNIMANQAMLQYVFELSENSVGVSWLPLFHDMGLIASLLNALFVGYPIYIMPPVAFIRDPARWLLCISKYKGTYTCAPNFAYDLCVKKISPEIRSQLDLSCLRKAINAAEPVKAITLKEFTTLFSPCGFSESAFTPAYGLAEATVFVSGKKGEKINFAYLDAAQLQKNKVTYSTNSQTNQILVGCGQANYLDQHIIIVNPETLQECVNEIGEIWVSGDHIAGGYLNKPELSNLIFKATADGNSRHFLRTGDLGFIDKSGELFITGRIKDLIIINGRNYYPQDIEFIVEDIEKSIRKNSIAAFSIVKNDIEEVVIVIEINRQMINNFDPQTLGSQINSALLGSNQPTAYEIIFIAAGTIPKTTSGKIQRQTCKNMYLNNQFSIVGKWENSSLSSNLNFIEEPSRKNEIIHCITAFIAKNKKIAIENITPQSKISDFNIDSIQIAELSAELENIIKRPLPEKVFYEYSTIQEITGFIIKPPASLSNINVQKTLENNNNSFAKSGRKIAVPKFAARQPSRPTEPLKG